MKILPTQRQFRRAQFRFTVRVFGILAIVLAVFAAIVAVHYLLDWLFASATPTVIEPLKPPSLMPISTESAPDP